MSEEEYKEHIKEKESKNHQNKECNYPLYQINLCIEFNMPDVTVKENYSFEFIAYDLNSDSSNSLNLNEIQNRVQNINPNLVFAIDPFMQMHGGHGHGTRDQLMIIKELHSSENFPHSNNIIKIESIFFVMGGDWKIRFLIGESFSDRDEWLEYKNILEQTDTQITVPW